MATRVRFWVEVTPRFAASTRHELSSAAGSASAPAPRLTELAAAVGLEGAELDAELASVREQRSKLAAYEAGLIERKATLGAAHPLPLLPGTRTDIRPGCSTRTGGPGSGGAMVGPDGAAAAVHDGPDPGDGVSGRGGPDPALQAADDFLPDEVAVLMNMSVPSARYLVEHALVLVRQLPAVWHALADGRIDDTRARVIVTALRWQAAGYGGPVPDDTIDALADRGVGWAASGCPPTTLKERLDTALIAADPAAADRRRQLRKRAADVTVTGTGDGLAELRAQQMDAVDARLVRAQVDAYAKVLKAGGDTRPIGAIRLAVLTSLVMRPWEQRDPATAHVTITADLSDLDHLPDLGDLADHPAGNSGTAGDRHGGPPRMTATRAPAMEGAAPPNREPMARASGGAMPLDAVPVDEELIDAAPADEEPVELADAAPTEEDSVGEEPTGSAAGGEPAGRATGGELAGRAAGGEPTGSAAGGELAGGAAGGASEHETAAPYRDPVAGGAGHVDGLPVTPTAVRALLQRIDALGLTHPGNGTLAFALTGQAGRVLAVATPEELLAAARTGNGIGPPPATAGYTPTAAQYRYLRARDRHCRFPGCRQVALACDADHVIPYDHAHPPTGGPTCVTNLTMLCRHHHRLKTHAKGWAFRLDPDGTLHVTTPGGVTRTTRPPAMDEILDLSTEPPPVLDPDDDPPPF